ncbi:MAG: hypothetical protein CMK32_05695 [Porticoccaceae bacterium]|nr:hypothetical protein [Porticoccaceae bacterium]
MLKRKLVKWILSTMGVKMAHEMSRKQTLFDQAQWKLRSLKSEKTYCRTLLSQRLTKRCI